MPLSAPTTTMSSTSKDQLSSKFHIRNNNSSNDNDNDDDDNYPTSKCIPFPYPTGPYLQQAALMDALLDGIPRQRQQRSVAHLVVDEKINVENKNKNGSGGDGDGGDGGIVNNDERKQKQKHTTRILALESPTGTGKSLSLACAGLAWLEYEESLYYKKKKNEVDDDDDNDNDNEAEDINVYDQNDLNNKSTVISPTNAISDRTTTTKTVTTGIDWLDSWQPPSDDNDKETERNSQICDKERHQKLLQKLDELRNQLHSPPSKNYHQQHQRQHQHQRHRERRENVLRMALTKSRMDDKKRLRNNLKKRKRNNNNRTSMMSKITLAYEDDGDDDDVGGENDDYDSSYYDHSNKYNNSKRKIRKKNFIPGTAEWLLQRQQQQRQQQKNSYSQYPVVNVARPPQILYAARTHSQLSQFVQEIRKTKWGKTLRVVALGSRGQGLCGELTTKTLNNNNDNNIAGITTKKNKNLVVVPENRLTETCLELRKNHNGSTTSNSNNNNKNSNNTSKKCSHYVNDESVATLAIHGLVEATDLEDFAKLGKVNKTCAYYATRMSIPVAQLIVLPYSLLCSTKSRNALGLTLHYNTLVLVDEAHNLPNAISNLNSASVTKSTTMSAQSQLDNYLKRYVDKLSSPHLRLLGQLKLLIRGLITSMTTGDDHNKKKKRRNHTTNATTTTTHLGKQKLSEQHKQRYLLSSSQFLVSQRLETINLFPVLRYMDESKLSQKLLGFMTSTSSSSTSKVEGKIKNYDVDDDDDSNGNKSNDIAAVTTNSCHISPMSIVETFLEKLTYANDDDGQVVVDKGTTEYDEGRENNGTIVATTSTSADRVSSTYEEKEPHLRFCVLNPAVQARDELWTSPRAVALVGGTLQPLDVMMRELIPGKVATHAATAQSMWTNDQQQQRTITSITNNTRNPYLNNRRIAKAAHITISSTKVRKGEESVVFETNKPAASMMTSNHHRLYRSDDFWAFTCGHVVDPGRVLLQCLTKVNDVTIDVRHKTRSTQAVTTAIGKALVRICQSVPHGVVVFLPSYKYEAILVNAWKKHSTRNNDKNTTNMSTAANDKSIWNQLEEATTVIREPKQASQVESTLTRYARNATKSSRGALLLSVVGGKLSEGINFADDLCRCVVVVGLPFADRSDPLLQEKLKLVANSSGNISSSNSNSSNCNIKSTAAQNYYRSLCLRAVNQSVGRAIRHAKDQATIVLMDARYPVDEAIARGLPTWLTESTPSWRRESGDLNGVIRRTKEFFDTL